MRRLHRGLTELHIWWRQKTTAWAGEAVKGLEGLELCALHLSISEHRCSHQHEGAADARYSRFQAPASEEWGLNGLGGLYAFELGREPPQEEIPECLDSIGTELI